MLMGCLSALGKGKKAIVDECHMVEKHVDVFVDVAREMDLCIVCRDLNPASSGLLEENYAAKGFHIKAKSCDFGPMGRGSKGAGLDGQPAIPLLRREIRGRRLDEV